MKLNRVTPAEPASGGSGSGMHLAGEFFRSLAAVDIYHVPYKGNGPAMSAVAGGQIPIAFVDLGSTASYAKNPRVKVLGIAARERTAMAPEIPSSAESGLPGWDFPDILGAIVGGIDQQNVCAHRAPPLECGCYAFPYPPAVGVWMTIAGALVGGVVVARLGTMRTLFAGIAFTIAANLVFAWLATKSGDVRALTFAISAENFSSGFAGNTPRGTFSISRSRDWPSSPNAGNRISHDLDQDRPCPCAPAPA